MSNQRGQSPGSRRKAGHGFVTSGGTHDCPAGFPIKGNTSSMLAHLPGGRWYEATIPEVCFATPEDAEDEGYRVTGRASERTWVRGDGSHACPEGFPIKGNLSSMIAHPPESRHFNATIPEVCFATAEAAQALGYRISGAGAHAEASPRPTGKGEPEPASSPATAEQNVETATEIAESADENAVASFPASSSEDELHVTAADTGVTAPPHAQPDAPAPTSNQPSPASAARITPDDVSSGTSAAAPSSAAQPEAKRRSIRHDGSLDCPADFPIKGIERTKTAVGPSDPGYNATIPDICFQSIGDASDEGYRSVSHFTAPRTASAPESEPTPDATLVVRIRRWWVKRKST